MNIELYKGDCLEVMKTIPDNSVDLVLTDIPYGEVNRKSSGLRKLDKGCADLVSFDMDKMLNHIIRVCKGSVYIFCGIEQVSKIKRTLVDNKFSVRLIVWEKTNPSPMNGNRIWLSGVECCVYGKVPKATFNGHCRNTVLRFPCGKSKIHPTQKPIGLFEDLIKVSSNENNIVLDPFMGSGTTGVACKNLNRNFIGIELDEKYFKIAKERIGE